MSAIVAGVMAAVAIVGKKKQDKEAAEAGDYGDQLAGIQTDIESQKAMSDAAVQGYNMTEAYGQLESEQNALASAMGKSRDSAGFKEMQSKGKSDLNRDTTRLREEAELVGKYGEITKSAQRSATASGQSQRSSSTNIAGLLTASRMMG